MMAKAVSYALMLLIAASLAVNTAGCAALKKKLTPKRKPKPKQTVFSEVRKYDVKPTLELYEKHYIFWTNWHKKFMSELGENYKSDLRSMNEMVSNLEDMLSLLTDQEAGRLTPHVAEMKKAEAIVKKRSMTKYNETRIRRIAEKEYRAIRREFTPKQMAGHIRKDWR